jgi:dihydroorotate dehydrogenase (fumarate)
LTLETMNIDLRTHYLGLQLANPLVASAGPLTGTVEGLVRLEEAGIGAAVLPSLFEEQIEHEELAVHRLYEYQTESYAEALTHLPELENYNTGPDNYLNLIRNAKRAITIPVIASLNGHTEGGWVRYAKLLEDAGADALELNIYFVPTDCTMRADDVEMHYLDLLAQVRKSLQIPLAVKIGAQFTSIPNFARRLTDAGAEGLVLFNRYLEPDIDLETLEVVPDLVLSQRHEVRLPLRWIAILRDQLACSLAASGGVHTAADVARVLLVGADVAMMTTTLLRHGASYVTTILDTLQSWLLEKEYASVEQLRGSMSRKNSPNPDAFERANYMKALVSYSTAEG